MVRRVVVNIRRMVPGRRCQVRGTRLFKIAKHIQKTIFWKMYHHLPAKNEIYLRRNLLGPVKELNLLMPRVNVKRQVDAAVGPLHVRDPIHVAGANIGNGGYLELSEYLCEPVATIFRIGQVRPSAALRLSFHVAAGPSHGHTSDHFFIGQQRVGSFIDGLPGSGTLSNADGKSAARTLAEPTVFLSMSSCWKLAK